MPRCIFCGEWAGADSEEHERCAEEFEKSVNRPGLLRRILALSSLATRMLGAFILRPFARAR